MENSEVTFLKNNNSPEELFNLIKCTNEIMSCEKQTLIQLSRLLRKLLQQNPNHRWVLEIDILVNIFEIKKVRLNTNVQTLNEFENFWRCKIGLYHTILKIIPVRE